MVKEKSSLIRESVVKLSENQGEAEKFLNLSQNAKPPNARALTVYVVPLSKPLQICSFSVQAATGRKYKDLKNTKDKIQISDVLLLIYPCCRMWVIIRVNKNPSLKTGSFRIIK